MQQKYPKRLIEVDLPIKRISAHARREKSIRHGHISTLHIWWARRPLAACRAVICASLWPDPADELCPQEFRDQAAEVMLDFCKAAATDKEIAAICSEESWGKYCALAKPQAKLDPTNPDHLSALRYLLLDFIADAAAWEASIQKTFLDTARKLTQAAHEALGGAPGTRPLVVDPFAGGGAIPLEALRMGADAFASDLNPVAVLLNKVVLEYIPKYGQRLADEVRKWGQWVKEQAEKELAQYYPKDPDGSTPIAYLWARTISCEGPGCGAEVPLIRSLWLCKKKNKKVAMKLVPRPQAKRVDLEIIEKREKDWVNQGDPGESIPAPKFQGTVKHGSATCPCCGYTTPAKCVRGQLAGRQGGTADARLLCIVTTRDGQRGRSYRLPIPRDITAVKRAGSALRDTERAKTDQASITPDEPIPKGASRDGGGSPFTVFIYGMERWGDLFTPRQMLSMTVLSRLVRGLSRQPGDSEHGEVDAAVQACLAMVVDKVADKSSSLCRWKSSAEYMAGNTFSRQALPMVLDFCEANPLGGATGDIHSEVSWLVEVLSHVEGSAIREGQAQAASATEQMLADDMAQACITDPPYYDAVPYADLSDFFFVWLRRCLPGFGKGLRGVPKDDECIVDASRQKDRAFFERQMLLAMKENRRVVSSEGIGVVVFAHKSTSGWEAQLQAMVDAGWTMTGSWPIDTEMGSRLRAMNAAALASSVHIVCRPREIKVRSVRTDDVGDWREVLQELPGRIHEWMPRLAREGVVGADAIFACLGPALEIFSRYSRVEKASGEVVELREYLEQVWAAVSQEALKMVFEGADASGFEEDARLTAMWLWTLGAGSPEPAAGSQGEEAKAATSTGYTLEFDAARKIAQGLGAHLEQLTGIIEVKGDKARLLPVSDRAQHLFGKGEDAVTATSKKKAKKKQRGLFEELDETLGPSHKGFGYEFGTNYGRGPENPAGPKRGETTLDRVHQAMLLFAAGRSEAVRRFLVEDGVGQDTRFWTLAQALSALYPPTTEEKRWVDGVLARKKSLGF